MSQDLELHPVANLFPSLNEEDYQKLREDIQRNGQLDPIMVHQGQIIDGRSRYQICQELGLAPQTSEWEENGSLLAFVIRQNLPQRRLNASQKAVIGLELEAAISKEIESMKARLKVENPSRVYEGLREHFQFHPAKKGDTGRAATKAAEITGASREYIYRAKRIKEKAPELISFIRAGKMNVQEALMIADLSTKDKGLVIAKLNAGEVKNVKDAKKLLRLGA